MSCTRPVSVLTDEAAQQVKFQVAHPPSRQRLRSKRDILEYPARATGAPRVVSWMPLISRTRRRSSVPT